VLDTLNGWSLLSVKSNTHAPVPQTVDIPVLLYHHIIDGDSPEGMTKYRFEDHIRALSEAGYTAVSLEDILAYMNRGRRLPENPVLITFDDGYTSNYTHAFPVLKQYDFPAVIFIIGVSFDVTDTYKDSGMPITPHFGTDESLEMLRSGLISIQSHSFDMHHIIEYDEPYRKGVLRMDGESEEDYIEAFNRDYILMSDLLKGELGTELFAFSYPYGHTDEHSASLLRDLGALITFTSEQRIATVEKGSPQSLYGLGRIYISEDMTGNDVIEMLEREWLKKAEQETKQGDSPPA